MAGGGWRILYPDVRSADDCAVERAVLPAGVSLVQRFESDPAAIGGDEWRAADAMIAGLKMPIDDAVFDRAPNLRIICRLGVGYDMIDTAAAARRGIPVCNVPDYGTTEVADHAVTLALSLVRGIVRYDEAFRDDPQTGWSFRRAPCVARLGELVFGVVGLGRIGTAAALRARAFGMTVVGYDPHAPGGYELALGIDRVDALEDLLGRADIVTLHCLLNDETRHLIDARAVAASKPGVIVVNTARGGIVDLDALYEGLKSGRVGAVGLDVFETEPPPADHPLIAAWRAREDWLAGRCVITPHAAFYSPTAVRTMRESAALTCHDYLAGGELRNCVNAALLQRPPARSG